MRICMIISTPFPPEDGIGYHVYNLSKKLIERGHKVTVLTRGSLKNVEYGYFDGIEIIKVFFVPIYPIHVSIHGYFINNLFKKIENKFDLVHIHTPLSPVIKTSLPIVSTIHTSITEDARHIENEDNFFTSLKIKLQTKYISQPLIQKLILNSAIITTVSNSVVRELKKDYYLGDIQIISNGVDNQKLCPLSKEMLSKDVVDDYILYVGRLSYRKGLFCLIEAAKNILENRNVKFVIVGKGEFDKEIKKKVSEYKLTNSIIFLGHVNREKLIDLYQHAKIFVMPSLYESGPLTLLEAMSCGKPVIATSVGIVPEVIINLDNGIMVRPGSSKDIVKSINLLLDNDKLRENFGLKARETVKQRYTWDAVTTNVEKCYKLALSQFQN